MPRFDPKKPKPDRASEFVASVEDVTIYRHPSKSLSLVSELLRRQQKNEFTEIILEKLDSIWEREIESVLVSEFGRGSTLYVIFYLSRKQDEIIMEIWDPNYVNVKPSQVFGIEGVPEYAARHFPKNRSQAEIGILSDWN